MLHFAGQFKAHTQANIYLYTAVSDGYFKRIVGFKALSIIGAHKQPAECCGWITIRALLDSLIFLFNLLVSFVSIKVIHTMHTSIYFVILILYFCEF